MGVNIMRLKNIVILSLILIILLSIGCSNKLDIKNESTEFSIERGMNGELITVNFEYLQENVYTLEKIWNTNESILFNYFESVHSQEILDLFAKEGEFGYPKDFDFDRHYMLIAYGRKIARLECVNDEYYGENWFRLIVTFAEEYSGEIVFFYQIDKRNYVPSDLGMDCYIMEGSERVYLGSDIYTINNVKFEEPAV